jgi:hypothetical protein
LTFCRSGADLSGCRPARTAAGSRAARTRPLAGLRGANTGTGARCRAICSITDRFGIASGTTNFRSPAAARPAPVGLLAPVDHRQERQHRRRTPGRPSTKSVSWSKVRSERTAGISGTSSTSLARTTFSDTSETLGGQSRMTSRTRPQGRDQAAEPVGRALGGVQVQVEVAVAEVGRHEVEPVEVGRLDRVVQGPPPATSALPPPLTFGLTGTGTCRALRIEVPDERPQTVAGGQVAEVDRGRGLPDAALDVVVAPPPSSGRSRGDRRRPAPAASRPSGGRRATGRTTRTRGELRARGRIACCCRAAISPIARIVRTSASPAAIMSAASA